MRIAASFPVRRVKGGVLQDSPFSLVWTRSKTSVGGLLVAEDGRKRTAYFVGEVTAPDGRLWIVKRRDTGEVHHVRLAAHSVTCDCIGFMSFRHCRHADSIGWLLDANCLVIENGTYKTAQADNTEGDSR